MAGINDQRRVSIQPTPLSTVSKRWRRNPEKSFTLNDLRQHFVNLADLAFISAFWINQLPIVSTHWAATEFDQLDLGMRI